MIATITPAGDSLYESISTCRFAKRVACVTNTARINEQLDPRLEIARLKREVDTLKAQLAQSPVTPNSTEKFKFKDSQQAAVDLEKCRELVSNFIEDTSPEAFLVISDARIGSECFKVFKELLLAERVRAAAQLEVQEAIKAANQLRTKLRQRDKEIGVLVMMLNAKKAGGNYLEKHTQTEELHYSTASTPPTQLSQFRSKSTSQINCDAEPKISSKTTSEPQSRSELRNDSSTNKDQQVVTQQSVPQASAPHQPQDVQAARQLAFEEFRCNHPDNEAIIENTGLLQNLYTQAKEMGTQMKETRNKINGLKALVEQHRIKRAMQLLSSTDDEQLHSENDEQSKRSPEEERLRKLIEVERASYKSRKKNT